MKRLKKTTLLLAFLFLLNSPTLLATDGSSSPQSTPAPTSSQALPEVSPTAGATTAAVTTPVTPPPTATPAPVLPTPVVTPSVAPTTPAPNFTPPIAIRLLNDLSKSYLPEEKVDLLLGLTNLLGKNIKDVQIQLELNELSAFELDPEFAKDPKVPEEQAPDKQETLVKTLNLPALANNQALRFRLRVKKDLLNTNAAIPVVVRFSAQPNGNDPAGCPLVTGYSASETYKLSLGALPSPTGQPDIGGISGGFSGGVSGGSGAEGVKNKPKLIVTKYSLEPKMPMAGQEFTLKMTFFNTNADKSCRNIKIILSTETPPASAGAAGEGNRAPAANTFTPVGSSNTFYIPRINAEESADKTISFFVAPTVESKNYTLLVAFEYEDADGNQLEAKESIGIPVVQEAKVQTDKVQIPESVPMGQPINIDFGVYNVGKSNLGNMMIEAVGNFTAEPPRSFVGNFASGASSVYSTTITPLKEGLLEGAIKVSYEDSTGKRHESEEKFKCQVEAQAMPKDFGPDGMPLDMKNLAEAKPLWMNPLVWSAAGLLLALIVGLIVRKKRKAKKIAKDLSLDE